MLNENGMKLWALNYAERKGIVNAKTIKAIQAGIQEGYDSFSELNCLQRLINNCEETIKSQNMNYNMTGKADGVALTKAEKNLELLKQIEL